MDDLLSDGERVLLLGIARKALEQAVLGQPLPPVDPLVLSDRLREPGATFVTLTRHGELRGCIGALEAYQALAEDVCEHAAAAAMQDYRFPPVEPEEIPEIEIEISRLTQPLALDYDSPDQLILLLRPGQDGVILKDGYRRATFLPQVWDKIPNPVDFLDHLCLKLGGDGSLWRRKKLQVYVYQVEEFRERASNPG